MLLVLSRASLYERYPSTASSVMLSVLLYRMVAPPHSQLVWRIRDCWLSFLLRSYLFLAAGSRAPLACYPHVAQLASAPAAVILLDLLPVKGACVYCIFYICLHCDMASSITRVILATIVFLSHIFALLTAETAFFSHPFLRLHGFLQCIFFFQCTGNHRNSSPHRVFVCVLYHSHVTTL